MKRFLTCALCFVSLPAFAATLWYERGAACPGLYRTKPLDKCNATAVTHLNITPVDEDAEFNGFYVNNQMIVDANGNVTSNALNILRGANLGAGSRIPQSYTCKNGFTKNNNGVCVDVSGNTTYVAGDSGEVTSPSQVADAPGCWWVYDFDIVFHDRPMVNPPHAVGTFADGLEPSNNSNITVSHRRGNGFYQGNNLITDIRVPQSQNYWFRGYYGKTFNYIDYQVNGGTPIPITDVITDHTTTKGTVWGARFAVPRGATSMNLGSPNLKTSYCDLEHPDTPPTNVVVNVYGGWARKCFGSNGDCGVQIYTAPSGAYTAGDVKYNHTCNSGYTLGANDDGNSYYVQCKPIGYRTINYSFSKYRVFKGTNLTEVSGCTPMPQNGTCNVGETFTLPGITTMLSCIGPNSSTEKYRFARWLTDDGILHNGDTSAQCTTAVLGGENANITAILCDCNYSYIYGTQSGSICYPACSGQ